MLKNLVIKTTLSVIVLCGVLFGVNNGFFGKVEAASYSITTPTTVVNQAYETSGGRKIVRLSNGWLIALVKDISTSDHHIKLYKSIDDGATFTLLDDYYPGGNVNGVSIVASGTNVHYVFAYNNSYLFYRKMDVITGVYSFATLVLSETAVNNVSLAIDSSGYLYAIWSSKNATYPNSFNIRYAKSTDGGVSWPNGNLTTDNSSSFQHVNPSVSVMSNGFPLVTWEYQQTGNYSIQSKAWNGSTWLSNVTIYSGGAYAQSNPSLTVASNGRIWAAWDGLDSADSLKRNIRTSYSDNNGVTWSSQVKLTTGNTYDQQKPSISVDKNNNAYIDFQGRTSGTYDQIRRIVYNNATSTWGSVTDLTSNTTASAVDPVSLAESSLNFSDPLTIYKDNQASAVKFRGAWIANAMPALTLTTSNNQTLSDESGYNLLSITGTTLDVDVNDVLTVKYQIDSSTPFALQTLTSSGSSQAFAGNYTVPSTLSDGSHTLKVWTEDNFGGVSTVSSRIFNVDSTAPGVLTNNVTTPSNVVNQAYDTSGNGGRKVVRLNNGWLISGFYESGVGTRLYKSTDYGSTWSLLRLIVDTNVTSFALSTNGTNMLPRSTGCLMSVK